MNNFLPYLGMFALTIILLAVIRARWTETSDKIKNLSPLGFMAVVVLIFACMVFLFVYVVKRDGALGTPGNPDAHTEELGDSETTEKTETDNGNAIILSGESIYINDAQVTREEAFSFIDTFIGSDRELIIVDDYSSSELHHLITDRCNERFVKYRNVDEKGNEQK